MRLLDKITQLICFFKKSQIIKINSKIVKVNVGSGIKVAPDWINIDNNFAILFKNYPNFVIDKFYDYSYYKNYISKKEFLYILKKNKFIFHDVNYGLPFNNNSVDYIYSSHFLEHLFLEDAKKLLRETFRILKKGGILRIVVPDLDYIIKLFNSNNKIKALNFFFSPKSQGLFHQHKYMYDSETITNILKDLGYKTVLRVNYQKGKVPDLKILDNRKEESLYIEATK